MKKRWLTSSFALLFLLSGTLASAHPGRTDAQGGHTCWTNCSRWGLEYGQYHYHNGGGSSSGSKKSSGSSSSTSKRSSAQTSKPKPAKPTPSYKESGLKVYVNGNKINFTSAPLIIENTNLVPLRDLVTALGASMNYDPGSGTIGVAKGKSKVTLTIGSSTVFYNGKSETASAAPKIIHGITYVPVQVIVKGLGAGMDYSSGDHSFKITIK